MRGIHNSVETVNAAAAVFVSAESRVQQVTVPLSQFRSVRQCCMFQGEDELLGSVCIGASGLMEMTGASTIQSLFLNLHFLCRMPLHSKMQAIHLNRGFYMLHLLSLRFPFCHRVLNLLVNLLYVLYLFLFCYEVCILPAAEFHLLSFPPSQPNLRLLTVPLTRTLALQNTFIS
ncbi:hypothetical protein C4D60_Mb07t10630 [Musa balbisiana]|uniref:Uncharacterized protein n=1 Tax=Musa balbisiana TaxID=52838 RepID=A0A4S8JED6_MUSBA|nr:hypothetical protein C4D60_Mb07t10630 [Musa balbisiana]